MRKGSVAVLSAVLAVALLAGCGSSGGSSADSVGVGVVECDPDRCAQQAGGHRALVGRDIVGPGTDSVGIGNADHLGGEFCGRADFGAVQSGRVHDRRPHRRRRPRST